jgi:AmiR/NasT family two-component response regulator
MKSRATIEHAKGILMGAHGCGSDAVFEFLTQAAQREDVTIRGMSRRTVIDATGREPAD